MARIHSSTLVGGFLAISFALALQVAAAVPAPRDAIVFVSQRDGNSEIYRMNADGSGQTNLTVNPAYDVEPVWSPDKTRILFSSNRGGNIQVHVMDADGRNVTKLTNSAERAGKATWSPTGEDVAFCTWRDLDESHVEVTICTMHSDGSAVQRVTSFREAEGLVARVVWAPDGKSLYYTWSETSYTSSRTELRTVRLDGMGTYVFPLPHVDRITLSPTPLSPDGTRMAFTDRLRDGLWLLSLGTLTVERLAQDVFYIGPSYEDSSASWSPDGTQLCLCRSVDGYAGKLDYIYIMDLTSGSYRRITSTGKDDAPCWSTYSGVR